MRFPAAICAFFIYFALTANAWADQPAKLIVAHGAISNNVAPLWIAREQGIFRKYGIDVDLVFIIAGRAAQAMMAGQVAVSQIGATHVANAVIGGGGSVTAGGVRLRSTPLPTSCILPIRGCSISMGNP